MESGVRMAPLRVGSRHRFWKLGMIGSSGVRIGELGQRTRDGRQGSWSGASSRESGGGRQEMGTSEGKNGVGSMKPWSGQSSRETEPRLGRSRRETVLYACLDMKSIILGKYHYMLYVLVLAMRPKMLMTVDENLKLLSVPVRVGQAVDVVGQVGQPKTIMGFQTHSTLTSSWRPS